MVTTTRIDYPLFLPVTVVRIKLREARLPHLSVLFPVPDRDRTIVVVAGELDEVEELRYRAVLDRVARSRRRHAPPPLPSEEIEEDEPPRRLLPE